MNFGNNFQNAVTFEISRSQIRYVRYVYGLLDFLSELGGLHRSIKVICFSLVYFFQQNGAFYFIMGELFFNKKYQPEQPKQAPPKAWP